MRLGLYIIAISVSFGCGASNEVTVETNIDAHAEFARYRTWAVAGPEAIPEGFSRVELGVMELEQLRDIAREVLAAKGYQEGTINNADIVFYGGLGQRTDYRVEYGSTSYRDAEGTYETTVSRAERSGMTEETLVLDGFERPSMFHVFQGRATVPSAQSDFEGAERALRALLDRVPDADPTTEPRTSGGEEPLAEGDADPAIEEGAEPTEGESAEGDAPAAE